MSVLTQVPEDSPLLAVVGIGARFPAAAGVQELWENLVHGVESVSMLGGADEAAARYVPARGLVDGVDEFDAELFDCSPREALLLDPQHRVFLECAYEALEDAGHDPTRPPGPIGVYAGCGDSTYAPALRAQRARLGVTDTEIRLATAGDLLTSRVAYKLGLRGPAITVQTACSTSLVAIHVAGQALLAGDCDVALAGGVTLHAWPRPAEYVEGAIAPDGRCRAFDAAAQGTVGGDGAGVVVLRRLRDALDDGDRIRAIVRGSAVNNDGADKIGYTAPGVDGQARVVRAALLAAGVSADSIGFVEAHGTGTPLGDSIEVAALTRAFRTSTDRVGFCRIGSVKTNLGHTDTAAGVAGFIKAVLAVERGLVPPTLHFRQANPQLDLDRSPFVVNDELQEWSQDGEPRRAAVHSLGIGGTNAHVVLEEAATPPSGTADRRWELFVFSARTPAALQAVAARAADHLRRHLDVQLADIAWTLQAGRRAWPCRQFAVCTDREQLVAALAGAQLPVAGTPRERPIVFMFPGQGAQHPAMGRELYAHEAAFRTRVDACAELLVEHLGFDLREVLAAGSADPDGRTADRLAGVDVAQPAVFTIEYALAGLLADWGVRPAVVVGHSLGAYAAACVAGVLSLPDALRLVATRGRLARDLPAGAMLAVALGEAELAPVLGEELDVAVVNGPKQTVVAGSAGAVERLQVRLTTRGITGRRLHVPAAGHSRYVEPIIPELARHLQVVELRRPALPMVSDTTGRWMEPDEPRDPGYWVRHLRQTVRFGDALGAVFAQPDRILLEVGPGQTLTALTRQHPGRPDDCLVVPTLPHPAQDVSERACLLTAVGELWASGTDISWPRLHRPGRRRVGLPAYPFQRQRYCVDRPDDDHVPDGGEPVWPGPLSSLDVDGGARDAEPADSEPRTEVQQLIVAEFARLLGVRRVGLDSDFFDLGGDSLVATRLASRVGRAFSVDLPARKVLEARTASALAVQVEELIAAGSSPR